MYRKAKSGSRWGRVGMALLLSLPYFYCSLKVDQCILSSSPLPFSPVSLIVYPDLLNPLPKLGNDAQCTIFNVHTGDALYSDHPWDQSRCPDYSGGLILGVKLYYKAYLRTFQSGLNTGVAIFQGFRLEGVHYKQS